MPETREKGKGRRSRNMPEKETIGNTKQRQANKIQKPQKRKRRTPRTAETETEQPRAENTIRKNTKTPNRRRTKKKELRRAELTPRKKGRNENPHMTRGETLIAMPKGLRTMNIASLNPDSMKDEQVQRDIIKDPTRNKIHIAAAQATHITQDRDYILDNYRIITASSAKREETGVVQGGTEIMLHGRTQQYITQITRKSSRVLRVTLDRRESKMPIHILATYAPQNGQAEAGRRHHWEAVKEILNKTCERQMLIWCADANGQLGSDKEEENEKSPNENTTQENRAVRKIKNRKRDGTCLERICQKQQMIPMATWKEPKKERQDTWENIKTIKT